MAYPQLVADATTAAAVDTTSHTIPLPTGSGGLLVGYCAFNGIPTVSGVPWGATTLVDTGTSSKLFIFYKFADGSEGASTITTTAEQSEIRVARYSGVDTVVPPEKADGTPGVQTAADTPSLGPVSWGAAENLWISVAAHVNGNTTVTGNTPPAGYTGFFADETGTGAAGCGLVSARAEILAHTEDPGAFGLYSPAGRSTAVATLAIKGTGGADTTPPAVPSGFTLVSVVKES